MTYKFFTPETAATDERTWIHNGKRYSAFSGDLDSIDTAQDFLKRNGQFWHERNRELVLFQQNVIPHHRQNITEWNPVYNVDIDKLVTIP